MLLSQESLDRNVLLFVDGSIFRRWIGVESRNLHELLDLIVRVDEVLFAVGLEGVVDAGARIPSTAEQFECSGVFILPQAEN